MKTTIKTHKVIGYLDEHGTFNVYVGTQKECDERLIKENEMTLDFEFSVVPLSRELHTHKVIDPFTETSYFSGTEFDCYEFIDEEEFPGDVKVVLFNDEEKLFFEKLSKKSFIPTKRKTHKVVDETLHEDENQDCFVGSLQECSDFVSEQNTIGLNIVPLLEQEIQIHNREDFEKQRKKEMQLKFKKTLESDSFEMYWYDNFKVDLPPFCFSKDSINGHKVTDQCFLVINDRQCNFEYFIGTTLHHVLLCIIEDRILNGYPKSEHIQDLILSIPGVNYFILEEEVTTRVDNFKPISLYSIIYDILVKFEMFWNEIIDMTEIPESSFESVTKDIPVKLYSDYLYVFPKIATKEKSDKVKHEENFDWFKEELLNILDCKSDNILIDYSITNIIVIKIPESSIFNYLEHEEIVKIKKLLDFSFAPNSANLYGNMIVINSKLN
jgi:hypothetical protein